MSSFHGFAGGRMSDYITRHIAAEVNKTDKLGSMMAISRRPTHIYENAIKAGYQLGKRFNDYLRVTKRLINTTLAWITGIINTCSFVDSLN
jgi:hypothetical protein